MNSSELKIPEYYVAKGQNGKEQIVKYHQKFYNDDNEIVYEGYYGYYGYHEVFTLQENMRELTQEERDYQSKHLFWNLPQGFYQSMPEF
jgi:hypothetical protein